MMGTRFFTLTESSTRNESWSTTSFTLSRTSRMLFSSDAKLMLQWESRSGGFGDDGRGVSSQLS